MKNYCCFFWIQILSLPSLAEKYIKKFNLKSLKNVINIKKKLLPEDLPFFSFRYIVEVLSILCLYCWGIEFYELCSFCYYLFLYRQWSRTKIWLKWLLMWFPPEIIYSKIDTLRVCFECLHHLKLEIRLLKCLQFLIEF